jgi:polyisoprenoid-binding protein YceI
MKKRLQQAIIGVLLGASLAATAHGAPEAYLVEPARTRARLSLVYFGYPVPLAQFKKTTGRVVFDGAARSASVDVVVDIDSIDTGHPAIDRVVQGEEFLQAATFPKAAFRSTRVHFVGDRPAMIEGTLTLRGVTQPVGLTVTSYRRLSAANRKKETIEVAAFSTVRRSIFGFGGLLPHFGDEIRVDIAIEVTRE